MFSKSYMRGGGVTLLVLLCIAIAVTGQPSPPPPSPPPPSPPPPSPPPPPPPTQSSSEPHIGKYKWTSGTAFLIAFISVCVLYLIVLVATLFFCRASLLKLETLDETIQIRRVTCGALCCIQIVLAIAFIAVFEETGAYVYIISPFFFVAGVLGAYGAYRKIILFLIAHMWGSSGLSFVYLLYTVLTYYVTYDSDDVTFYAHLPYSIFMACTSMASWALISGLRVQRRTDRAYAKAAADPSAPLLQDRPPGYNPRALVTNVGGDEAPPLYTPDRLPSYEAVVDK